ncbi:MAG TPA: urate hydroxylase PuuD, partial [Acidimicrobiia bacterium]|nr:urate hydroxylase PuuD [Acidimicrobiia bacterium]
LLWFFNVVQTPAYAEMEPGARNNAFDKLTWRALWWFRWAAMATVAFGVLIIGQQPDVYDVDYWKSPAGATLLLGIAFGLTMFLNVWLVIWPNQQKVIANARNVQAGGEADPEAAGAARRGAMASRQNTIFSLPLLVFMVGASHFYQGRHWVIEADGSDLAVWFIVGLAILGLLEANALGLLGGTAAGGPRTIYDTHRNAIITGAVLIVVLYLLSEGLFKA